MLTPDSRVVLIDSLRAPEGFRLDAAIATTFTLDLEAALIPPLAFAAFELRTSPDPIAALEAIRSCADRVDLFCQTGQIKVPAQASDLLAFLEPMVHEVTAFKPGYLFHPKVWFVRYSNDDDDSSYRLLCATRNLTQDRSWDAVVRLDGVAGTRPHASNRPLSELIRALSSRSATTLSPERAGRIVELAEDARRVEWEIPPPARDMAFHTWGVPSTKVDADFSGRRHLIVSPFCNDDGVRSVTGGVGDAALVSRTEELDRLASTTLEKLTTYTLDPYAGLSEEDDEAIGDESSGEPSPFAGLHAKIIAIERGRQAHVFIGSPNATSAALNGNVEFAVELVGPVAAMGIDAWLSDESGLGLIVRPYEAAGDVQPDPADEELRALENALRAIASRSFTITIRPTEEQYECQLTTGSPLLYPSEYRAFTWPITREGHASALPAERAVDISLGKAHLADITPFLAIKLETPAGLVVSTVVRAQLINDPDGRLDVILARQVDTPEKFLKFLALLLGLNDPNQLLGSDAVGGGTGSWSWNGHVGAGVMEAVLGALGDHPDGLKDLDRLVQRLQATEAGTEILPKGFDQLWGAVLDALSRRSEVLR